MSGRGWCAGAASPPTAGPGQINHAFVDPMSLVHVGVGLAFGLFRFGFFATLAIAVGWELLEHVLKSCVPHWFVFPSQDTLVNSTGDVLCTMLGWAIGHRIDRRVRYEAR